MQFRRAKAIVAAAALVVVTTTSVHAWDWQDTADLASEVWPEAPAAYVANIAECESHNNPGAVGGGWWRLPNGRSFYQTFIGLMQIDGVTNAAYLDIVGEYDLTIPSTNLKVARQIQREQGWRAWPVCSR